MSAISLIVGMAACVMVWGVSYWREKKRQLGNVSLIPAHYIQFSALIIFLVLAANLVAITTGVEWQSPFRR